MRIVTGTLKPTPTEWLPILSNIAPPDLRRKKALMGDFTKIKNNSSIPLYHDLHNQPRIRLKSRKPPIILAQNLNNEGFNITSSWEHSWETSGRNSPIFSLNRRKEEFNLPRRSWCNLNRLRTSTARTNDNLFKWGIVDDQKCECGFPKQTIEHILRSCPKLSYPGHLDEIIALEPEARKWLSLLNL